jgi:hypothetical protein
MRTNFMARKQILATRDCVSRQSAARLLGFHPFRVRDWFKNSSAARANNKQENAQIGNRTMHCLIYTQSVHLNAGNNNRGPEVPIAAGFDQYPICCRFRLHADQWKF